MRILLSKLPETGWWHNGIPKYLDNPAMQEGAVPDPRQLAMERQSLIKIIKMSGHEVIEVDFPSELDGKDPKHDFVFIRDPFISDQKGTAVILRAGEPLRREENPIIRYILESIGMKVTQIPDRPGVRADGGEFYFCKKENVLFSGLQRNSRIGADYVAQALNVNEMIILEGLGYHLDTFFTPALKKDGTIGALIVCTSVLSDNSKKVLYTFADNKNIPVFDIPIKDAIGTPKKIGSFSANALPLPGILIRPNHFTDQNIDDQLLEIGIQNFITSTSQFELSGGSIHCITNEL